MSDLILLAILVFCHVVKSEVVSEMLTCKYEKYCLDSLMNGDIDCQKYDKYNLCSEWDIYTFEETIKSIETVYSDNDLISVEHKFTIEEQTAIIIPTSFFPSQLISLRFYIELSTYNSYSAYLTDSLLMDYSSMYKIDTTLPQFLVHLNALPAKGILYLIVKPKKPATISIRLLHTVNRLVIPEVEDNWWKRVFAFIIPHSVFSFQSLLLCISLYLVTIWFINAMKTEDVAVKLSTTSKYVLNIIRPNARTRRVHKKGAAKHPSEPLSLLSNKSSTVETPETQI